MDKRIYVSIEHAIEDALIEETNVYCLDERTYAITLSVALVRLEQGLPVKAKAVNGKWKDGMPLVATLERSSNNLNFIPDEILRAWPNCDVPDCDLKSCLALNSMKCAPHTILEGAKG